MPGIFDTGEGVSMPFSTLMLTANGDIMMAIGASV
jgi:hypothetical protein